MSGGWCHLWAPSLASVGGCGKEPGRAWAAHTPCGPPVPLAGLGRGSLPPLLQLWMCLRLPPQHTLPVYQLPDGEREAGWKPAPVLGSQAGDGWGAHLASLRLTAHPSPAPISLGRGGGNSACRVPNSPCCLLFLLLQKGKSFCLRLYRDRCCLSFLCRWLHQPGGDKVVFGNCCPALALFAIFQGWNTGCPGYGSTQPSPSTYFFFFVSCFSS